MERKSGVLMHVSSLPSGYSCGNFGKCSFEFIDFLKESGFTFWQVLPFCMPDEFFSPYKSYSTFSINPYFLDLEDLYERGLITKEELALSREKESFRCEIERLKSQRLSLLKKASEKFDFSECEDFYKEEKDIETFANFMAEKSFNNGREWHLWDKQGFDKGDLRLWLFSQYILNCQWKKVKSYANERGIKIIGDLPFYLSFDSAEVKNSPKLFDLKEDFTPRSVAGVPPDYFSPDGQVWGNPLYNFHSMKKDNYDFLKRRFSFYLKLFDGVRIDHFRAFESYFEVPFGEKTAKYGKWKKGPGLSFIKEIKKVVGEKLVIAEDLGEITDRVVKLLDKSGFPGMRVLQFGFLSDAHSPHLPHNYKNNCVAYTGTHDNNTLLGYLWECEKSKRQEIFDYFGVMGDDIDLCFDAILRQMLQSHAGLVIFPIQDLLKFGCDTRMNCPGTVGGNWLFRVTSEQLNAIDKNKFMKLNRTYGRI